MKTIESQLNNLSSIIPSAEWKARTRDVLQSQICAGAQEERAGFFAVLDNLMPAWVSGVASRPVAVFAMIVLAVVTGSYASVRAARETTPGDSLYIAKIINEKTQLALTFDETDKTKLNLEFATNRAEELVKMMEAPTPQQEKTIADLKTSFSSELTAAKSRLTKIKQSQPVAVAPKTDAAPSDIKQSVPNDEKVQVFGANLGKDNVSMQIIEAEQLFANKDISGTIEKIDQAAKSLDAKPAETKATTTPKEEKETEKATSTK
ncbi:hypothetical protein HGA34_00175 [Candidatus Falkowbacteria bacterium]|nr:hypothetical protein [Candidatus Falkowbacteria bacterium]